MRNFMFAGLLATASIGLFLSASAHTTRPDTAAPITAVDDPVHNALRSVAWLTCGWVSGVYGPVRVCN